MDELDKILFTAELKGTQYKTVILGLGNSGVFEAIEKITEIPVTNEDIRSMATAVMIGIERNGPMNSADNILHLIKSIAEARPDAKDPLDAVCAHLQIEVYDGSLGSLSAAEVRQVEISLGGAWKKIREQDRQDQQKQ